MPAELQNVMVPSSSCIEDFFQEILPFLEHYFVNAERLLNILKDKSLGKLNVLQGEINKKYLQALNPNKFLYRDTAETMSHNRDEIQERTHAIDALENQKKRSPNY